MKTLIWINRIIYQIFQECRIVDIIFKYSYIISSGSQYSQSLMQIPRVFAWFLSQIPPELVFRLLEKKGIDVMKFYLVIVAYIRYYILLGYMSIICKKGEARLPSEKRFPKIL